MTTRPRTPCAAAPALLAATLLTLLLTGCAGGGQPWGAMPQNIPAPDLSGLKNLPAVLDAGSTAGSHRLAERVRSALSTQPELAGADLRIDVFEGGLVILNGQPATSAERELALRTIRSVAGVRDVVDRTATARPSPAARPAPER